MGIANIILKYKTDIFRVGQNKLIFQIAKQMCLMMGQNKQEKENKCVQRIIPIEPQCEVIENDD